MSLEINPIGGNAVTLGKPIPTNQQKKLTKINALDKASEETYFKKIIEEYMKQNGPKVTIDFLTNNPTNRRLN